MLTKAGKFKFNAETALHSPLLCVGAGGGEETLPKQPAVVSTPRTAPRGSPGLLSLRTRVFGNFTDGRVEAVLRLVPLCRGCGKGSNVHTIREQSCIGEMYFKGFHLKDLIFVRNFVKLRCFGWELLCYVQKLWGHLILAIMLLYLFQLSWSSYILETLFSNSLVLTIQKMNCDAGLFFLPWIVYLVLDQVIQMQGISMAM